jgi:cytochrome c553
MRIMFFIITVIAGAVMLAACGGAAAVIPQTGADTGNNTQSEAQLIIEPQAAEEVADESQVKGDPERGRQIFETGGEKYKSGYPYCIKCHSLDGSENKFGPTMQGISERAGERVPELSADEYLRQSILEPDAYVVGDYPESMGRIHAALLSDEEIEDLVAFMLTQ